MRDAATLRNRRGRVSLATIALAFAVASCGGGGGKNRSFQLPAGTEFDATPSDRVLIAVETHNECTAGECVAPTDTACELGAGNVRGLAIYRVGSTGLLVGNGDPRAGAAPEALIATADNPRRVIVHPNDPTLLYVATRKRIQVFRLAGAGGSRCIDQTLAEKEVVPGVKEDLDPIDVLIDPTVGTNGVLYVGSRGANRLDAYTIADDGTIPDVPTSCAVAPNKTEYAAVTLASSGFIVAAGRTSIDIYERRNGQFLPRILPTTGEMDAACIDAHSVSTTTSSIGGAFVTDLLFVPTPDVPVGRLFIGEEVSRRIFTFQIDSAGVIGGNDTSSTKRLGVPQNLLKVDRPDGSVLYASVFNQGRVDVYRLEDGLLPSRTFSRTAEDPDALPVALTADPTGSVLYVAEGGLGRVDGFRIQPDGGLADLPATSTGPLQNSTGDTVDSFPNDLAIVALP